MGPRSVFRETEVATKTNYCETEIETKKVVTEFHVIVYGDDRRLGIYLAEVIWTAGLGGRGTRGV